MQYIYRTSVAKMQIVFAFMVPISAAAHFGMMDCGALGVEMKRINNMIPKKKQKQKQNGIILDRTSIKAKSCHRDLNLKKELKKVY